ncbi:MAG: fused signal recognition particle receptor, partial [Colwellia sp.]
MSKKKGMLSWLGFSKKEKQPSTEESNNEIEAAVEAEQ